MNKQKKNNIQQHKGYLEEYDSAMTYCVYFGCFSVIKLLLEIASENVIIKWWRSDKEY